VRQELVGVDEIPLAYSCGSEAVTGFVHLPTEPLDIGVLMVVGGPQYKVGSHRQFVILARYLAARGIPVFRFDYRGMGDSTGPMQDFESSNLDISSAIDVFLKQCGSVKKLVLWGLCDAASAISFYAPLDDRVGGLVMLNPWVRTEQSESKVFLKDYYIKRLRSKGFWLKVITKDFDFKGSIFSFAQKVKGAGKKTSTENNESLLPLPKRVIESMGRFEKDVLIILSGDDLTAKEFVQLVETDSTAKGIMSRKSISRLDLEGCNHTFSKKSWRHQVNEATCNWVTNL